MTVFTATETAERCGRATVYELAGQPGKYLRLIGRQSLADKLMRVRARFGHERIGWFVPMNDPDEEE